MGVIAPVCSIYQYSVQHICSVCNLLPAPRIEDADCCVGRRRIVSNYQFQKNFNKIWFKSNTETFHGLNLWFSFRLFLTKICDVNWNSEVMRQTTMIQLKMGFLQISIGQCISIVLFWIYVAIQIYLMHICCQTDASASYSLSTLSLKVATMLSTMMTIFMMMPW